ncbi:MAG TPA: MBL fold hydrolase, partial [Firmicutes bacterium]|nr:MBL fold hydrolase [Bacillota bacterium]
MRISFCGAARTVTGSCFLLENGGSHILVDCGMFQGNKEIRERNDNPFPFNPAEIDAVLLTHA